MDSNLFWMKSLCGFPFKTFTGSISNEINHALHNHPKNSVPLTASLYKVLELLSIFCAVVFILASNPSEASSEARWDLQDHL